MLRSRSELGARGRKLSYNMRNISGCKYTLVFHPSVAWLRTSKELSVMSEIRPSTGESVTQAREIVEASFSTVSTLTCELFEGPATISFRSP